MSAISVMMSYANLIPNWSSNEIVGSFLGDGLDEIRRRLYGSDDEVQTHYGENNHEGTYHNRGSIGHYCLRLPFLLGI